MKSPTRRKKNGSRFTTFDWLAMLFVIFGLMLVLGATTLNTMTGGELVIALTVLASAFIVRGGISKTTAQERGRELATGRHYRAVRKTGVNGRGRASAMARSPRRAMANGRAKAPVRLP